MKRLLHEPLLHFLALGGALFALYGFVRRDTPPPRDVIVVDQAQVSALVSEHERVWRRPPNERELQHLIDGWVRDQVLYREGLATGLDRDDPVVRRRIVQKMTFIAEGMASELPSDAEVERWFRDHAQDYRLDPVYTLRQVYFDPQRHAQDLDVIVQQARTELESSDQTTAGDRTLLPASLDESPAHDVARVFGEEFAGALAALPTGKWSGPVRSGFGVHLVLVRERKAARVPPLREVRKAVERDLSHARTNEAVEAFYRSARARYDVRVEASREHGNRSVAARDPKDAE